MNIFTPKQAKFLDEMLSQFGQISPDIKYVLHITEKATVVRFAPDTVKMLVMNARQIKHRHLASLCKQLANTVGVAKFNPEDERNDEKGKVLASIRFVKNVARTVLGTQKQIHADATKKVDFFTKKVNNVVEKLVKRIERFKGAE